MDTASVTRFTAATGDVIVLLPAVDAPLTSSLTIQPMLLLTMSKSAATASVTCSASLHSGFAAVAKEVGSLSVHAATGHSTVPMAIRSSPLEAIQVSATREQ